MSDRTATFFPEAIGETIEAIWDKDSHVLEVSNPGTDSVLLEVNMVMSLSHAMQIVGEIFGPFAQHITLSD